MFQRPFDPARLPVHEVLIEGSITTRITDRLRGTLMAAFGPKADLRSDSP